jgi:polyisoprenyl-teichoic acid--peptidoglycan teichoic acid transferase
MSQNIRSARVDKKKKRRKRIFIWIIMPILILVLSGAGYATFLYKKAESVVNNSYKPVDTTSKREKKVDPKMDNISILLIGIDESKSRKGIGTRTDALMVATLNKKNHSIKLLSIPRDSYVHIPEKDIYTKITHAHAYGGTKLTIETVQELLDIPIDYYVKMNFYAFIDVVNALDGIQVEVPYSISEKDSEDHHNAIRLKPGLQTLDGEEALALARTRHKDNDIMRGMRQQDILKAIIKKAASVNSITKEGKVIDAIGDNMATNLTFNEMKSLTQYVTTGKVNIESLKLDGTDDYINKIYYYKLDETSLENNIQLLKEQLSTNTNSNIDSSKNMSDESSSN